MSFISMNTPTVRATADNMEDFLSFVHTHESLLKQYGAIKIIPPIDFKNVLKKDRIKLKPPATIQQITQLNQDDFIYSINTDSCMNEKEPKHSSPVDENAFWLSLSQSRNQQYVSSSVSIIPTKSFFLKRVHRTGFDFHQLPRRSFLRFCNDNLLRQFVPSLIRTHGPGGIFPLASARQRLFSFNYHHGGGIHYWYIVPASEREVLERVLQRQTNSTCLEHRHLLINPLMFDKYKIRYHRLIQRPNEIIILAAGALSQGFTEDTSWSETIDFVLPSWLDDGHANAETSCSCKLNITSLPTTIDTNLFSPACIQRYLSTNLNITIDDKSSSDSNEQCSEIDEMAVSSNISFLSADQLLNQVFESCSSGSSFEVEQIDENDQQWLIQTSSENTSGRESGETTYSPPTYRSQTSFESIDNFSQLPPPPLPPQYFDEEAIRTGGDGSFCLSYQELLDIIATPPSIVKSTESQTEEQIDDPTNILNCPSMQFNYTQTKSTHNSNDLKNREKKRIKDANKTLIIFGMKTEVTKTDIQRHFVGCKKVTIKQSHLPHWQNYAFVQYRTRREAEYNRKRPIDHLVFGFNCRVDYVKKNVANFNGNEASYKCNVVVRRIPENVTEDYLRNLFVGCYSLKYIPARVINSTKTNTTSTTNNKILWGYAFLYYNDPKAAANVINNADTYRINNQPLIVSGFDKKKLSSTKKEQMSYIRQSSTESQNFNDQISMDGC